MAAPAGRDLDASIGFHGSGILILAALTLTLTGHIFVWELMILATVLGVVKLL